MRSTRTTRAERATGYRGGAAEAQTPGSHPGAP